MTNSGDLARQFRWLGGSSHLAMALLDAHGVVLETNPAFANLLGRPVDQLCGCRLAQVLHADDQAACDRLRRLHERRSAAYGYHWIDIRLQGAAGDWITARASMGSVGTAGERGTVLYVERRGPAQKLQPLDGERGARLHRELVAASGEPVLVVDAAGRLQFINPAAAMLFQSSETQLLGQPLEAMLVPRHHGKEPAVDLAERVAAVLSDGQPERLDLLGVRADGSGIQVSVQLVALDLPGEPSVLLRLKDLTEDQRREEQLSFLTHFDPVTGLPNRALFSDRLEQALRRAQREEQSVVLAFVDLDRFKHFNETLGHHCGDALLAEVAQRLRSCLRDSDTIARLGGDEFAIVLEGDAALINSGKIARKLLDVVAEPLTLADRELFVTASLGFAIYAMDGNDAGELIRHAEIAMYRAKESGRNTYCFYAPVMNSAALDRLELESDLRYAIERDELVLYYQPQVRAESGEVVGLEALLRWRRGGQLIPPGEFVPVLEETRLILPVGRWVLEQACRQAVALERKGLGALRVAVNISAHQFRDEGFVQMVSGILRETGLPPAQLDLEITETLLMEQTSRTMKTLAQLEELGVRISLDDFGTGYSSLAYLKRFPVDTLKIDRSFMSGIPDGHGDVAIASAIIALAEELGLEVVAEAVETPAQLEFLQRWERITVQGYLFSPALPVEELIPRLLGGRLQPRGERDPRVPELGSSTV